MEKIKGNLNMKALKPKANAKNAEKKSTARNATIKDGKVNNVYIITEGENYPVSDQPEVVITDINIINPGQNYDEGDTVTDNIGNDYDVTILESLVCNLLYDIPLPSPGRSVRY